LSSFNFLLLRGFSEFLLNKTSIKMGRFAGQTVPSLWVKLERKVRTAKGFQPGEMRGNLMETLD